MPDSPKKCIGKKVDIDETPKEETETEMEEEEIAETTLEPPKEKEEVEEDTISEEEEPFDKDSVERKVVEAVEYEKIIIEKSEAPYKEEAPSTLFPPRTQKPPGSWASLVAGGGYQTSSTKSDETKASKKETKNKEDNDTQT